jgi:hypothetical protein
VDAARPACGRGKPAAKSNGGDGGQNNGKGGAPVLNREERKKKYSVGGPSWKMKKSRGFSAKLKFPAVLGLK